MIFHNTNNLLNSRRRNSDRFQKQSRWCLACLFVTNRPNLSIDHSRTQRLAKVVRQCPQQNCETRFFNESFATHNSRSLVDNHQRMNPNVTLWMPFWILRRRFQRWQFRVQHLEDAKIESELQSDRRFLGKHEQLPPFITQSFWRKLLQSRHGCLHDIHRFRIDGQIETRRKLQGSKYAQRIVAEKNSVDDAQDLRLEIARAVRWIDNFICQRIHHDGVDSEITTSHRIIRTH